MLHITSILTLVLWNASFNSADMDADSISQPECVNRFEYRHELREKWFTGCEELFHDNPYCHKNYTVAYGDFPPYVFFDKHENKVKGILIGQYHDHTLQGLEISLTIENCRKSLRNNNRRNVNSRNFTVRVM